MLGYPRPKRWTPGIIGHGGSYSSGQSFVELSMPQLREVIGPVTNYAVRNVGFWNDGTPKPLLVMNDLLIQDSRSDGLLTPDSPIIEPCQMLLEAAVKEDILVILPNDSHENPEWFDKKAPSNTIATELWYRFLTDDEKARLDRLYPGGQWRNRRLTLGELDFVVQDICDSPEARKYIRHCTDGKVQPLAFVQKALLTQRQRIEAELASGRIPEARVIPVFKDTLDPNRYPDQRGRGGNKMDEIIIAAHLGDYPFQGRKHYHEKQAVVAGAFLEWSTDLGIVHLITAELTAVAVLTAIDALQIFDSKLHMAQMLKERHGRSIYFTYDWPGLGSKPRGWDRLMKDVLANDLETDLHFYPNWVSGDPQSILRGSRELGQWRRWGRQSATDSGKPLIQSWVEIQQELKTRRS